MIYLDSAATTLHKPPEVAEAVKQAILTAGNAARGAHCVSLAASRTVFETRQKLAQLFSCPREDHVVFTMNSTRGAQHRNLRPSFAGRPCDFHRSGA